MELKPGMVQGANTLVDILQGREDLMNYKIAIHRSDEGISVSVPALSGCWSEGNTEEEALSNIQDAIRDRKKTSRMHF